MLPAHGKLIVAALLALVLSGPTAHAQSYENGHMYLSVAPDHYDPGLNEPHWNGGEKTIFVVLENASPEWIEGSSYGGIEFGLDYPPELFIASYLSPAAPAPLFWTNNQVTGGHHNLQMGAGGEVYDNPWAAVHYSFYMFAPLANMLFSLDRADNPSPYCEVMPAYTIWHGEEPYTYCISSEPVGSGDDHKPDWRAGVVLLNYDPQTLSPELESELSSRIQDPGHPLWMAAVPLLAPSWGQLKAEYGLK